MQIRGLEQEEMQGAQVRLSVALENIKDHSENRRKLPEEADLDLQAAFEACLWHVAVLEVKVEQLELLLRQAAEMASKSGIVLPRLDGSQ